MRHSSTRAERAAWNEMNWLPHGTLVRGYEAVVGYFAWNDHGVFTCASDKGTKPHSLVAAWDDVVSLRIEGEQPRVLTTRSQTRRSFTFRRTLGRATTTSAATSHLLIGLADDELVITFPMSPVDLRASLGPAIARFRHR